MSRYNIEIAADESHSLALDAALTEAAAVALDTMGVPDGASLTILLTGDDRLRQLNRRFMGIDASTDVLSFPSGEPGSEAGAYLGDVAISLATATRQAEKAGQTLLDELLLLIVHAVLHLLGYDHAEEGEKEQMWRLQAEILGIVASQRASEGS
jgi:probable rRNA maturation factor